MANEQPGKREDKEWARTQFGYALKSLFVRRLLPNGRSRRYTPDQFAEDLKSTPGSRDIEPRSVQNWAKGSYLPEVIEPVFNIVSRIDPELAERLRMFWEVGNGLRDRPATSVESADLSLDWDDRPEAEEPVLGIELDLLRPYRGNEPGELKINGKIFFEPSPVDGEKYPDYLIGVHEPQLRISSVSHAVSSIIGDDQLPHNNFRKTGNGKTKIVPALDHLSRVTGDPLRDSIIAYMQPRTDGAHGKITVQLTIDQRNFIISQRMSDGRERQLLADKENRKAIIGVALAKASRTTSDGHVIIAHAEMNYKPRSDAKT
jgi:hypothetical protein